MKIANKEIEEMKDIKMKKDDEIKYLKVVQESNEKEILEMSHHIRYLTDESEDRKERIQIMENKAIQSEEECVRIVDGIIDRFLMNTVTMGYVDFLKDMELKQLKKSTMQNKSETTRDQV